MMKLMEKVGNMNCEEQRAIIVLIIIVLLSIIVGLYLSILIEYIIHGKMSNAILTIVVICIIMYILSNNGITFNKVIDFPVYLADFIMGNLQTIFS